MERSYNKIKKQEYAKELKNKGLEKRADEILAQQEYSPVHKPIELHPEIEVPEDDVNLIFSDIKIDSDIILNSMSDTAKKFKGLLETTKTRLDEVRETLQTEKERLEDINILCNKYTDFANAMLISEDNATGTLKYDNKAFSLQQNSSKGIKGYIVSVVGNGYEGNKYVYKNNKFMNETNDTSNKNYMIDNDLLTYYEYSRITAANTEPSVFPLVNFDSIMARCTVLIEGQSVFNTIEMSMDTQDAILESVHISLDGQTYTKLGLSNVAINSKDARFESKDYVFGSGILSFKDSKYVKLTLKAAKNSNDIIAFENEGTLVKLDTAKRSVIKINNIKLSKKTFQLKGQMVYSNFITDPVKSIAIFANEYVADDLDLRSSIKYTLTVNGDDYDMIPINSNYNGKKIVRTTSHAIEAEYVFYISESVKNASLTVNLSSNKSYASPYVSDLKILVGGE